MSGEVTKDGEIDAMGCGSKGKKNIYTCKVCRDHVVTVDKDSGVTPFTIGCQRTIGCAGYMTSSMYRVFDQSMKAAYVWYRPTEPEIAALGEGTQHHVRQGGLIMRRAREGEAGI